MAKKVAKRKSIKEPEEIEANDQELEGNENKEEPSNIARVNIRVPKAYKDDWEAFAKKHKFPSFTQFIIFAVNEVVERGIKREVVQDQMGMVGGDYEFIKEMMQQNRIQQDKYMGKINDILSALSHLPGIKVTPDLKKRVKKYLVRMSTTSDDLADFFEVDEAEILVILHELMDAAEVRLNADVMKYEVVKDGNS